MSTRRDSTVPVPQLPQEPAAVRGWSPYEVWLTRVLIPSATAAQPAQKSSPVPLRPAPK